MDYDIDQKALNESREQTVLAILDKLRDNDRVVCVRYTGYGKSYYVVNKLVQKLNKPVLMVVPNKPLVHQYRELLKGVKVITYQAIRHYSNAQILSKFKDIKYVICDECHHLGKNKWKIEFVRLCNLLKCKIIGLTATPIRGDTVNVISEFFNDIQIEPMELIDGISNKFIPKIKYVVAYAQIDNIVDYRLSEIDRYKIENLLNVPNILKKYIDEDRLKSNLKILVYVSQVKYIDSAVKQCKEWFSTLYPDKVINIYSIHSYNCQAKTNKELNEFKQAHNDNVIDIMISIDMLIEGLHLPTISVEIMLRKTKSPVVYFQQMGRVINSKQPLVFDLINNSNHLYQLKNEYNNNIIRSLSWNDKTKLTFDECVELCDETQDIEKILLNYHKTKRSIAEIILEIDTIIEQKLEFIKQCNHKVPINKVLKILGLSHNKKLRFKQELLKYGIDYYDDDTEPPVEKFNRIIKENLDYILTNPNGFSINRLAIELGISRSGLEEYLKRNNLKVKNLPKNKNYTNIILENVDYIKNNPDNLTKQGMADKFNIPISAFRSAINRYNIDMKVPNNYKEKYAQAKLDIDNNISYIKENISTMSINELAKKFNIPSVIFQRYIDIKYGIIKKNKINEIDYDYVVENPDNLTVEELAKKFGYTHKKSPFILRLQRKGISQIKYNGKLENLPLYISQKYIDKINEQQNYIIENKYNETTSDMAKKFGVTYDIFKQILNMLQIPLPKRKSNIDILIETNMDFIKEHSNEYTSSGMATELIKQNPSLGISRSGLSSRLSKLSDIEFMSKY